MAMLIPSSFYFKLIVVDKYVDNMEQYLITNKSGINIMAKVFAFEMCL